MDDNSNIYINTSQITNSTFTLESFILKNTLTSVILNTSSDENIKIIL